MLQRQKTRSLSCPLFEWQWDITVRETHKEVTALLRIVALFPGTQLGIRVKLEETQHFRPL